MSDEARIADLETIKALANLLGEHPRAEGSANCAGCQTEGYSLFTYYVHVAKAILAAGYMSPEEHRAGVEVTLSDGASLLTNAMLRQDELQERAEKAERTIAAVRKEVDNPDNDRRMSLLIIGALVCPDPPVGVWDGTTWQGPKS